MAHNILNAYYRVIYQDPYTKYQGKEGDSVQGIAVQIIDKECVGKGYWNGHQYNEA